MANLFKFTNPTTNTIALEKGRTGTVRQTVTNESGRSVQAITRIDITPADSAARDWIRIEPKGTTPMKINGTAHYDVIVEVPEGKTLDKPVTFKLTVADEFSPEEHYSTGPDMTFVPPDQAPVKKSNKGLIIGAIIAVVVLILVGIGAAIALRPKGDDAPRLKLLDNVTVYSEPSTSSTPVTDLTEGVELPVSLISKDEAWYLVTLENGETGWVQALARKVEYVGDFSTVVTATSTATATSTPTETATPTLTPTATLTSTPTITSTPCNGRFCFAIQDIRVVPFLTPLFIVTTSP